MRSPTHICQLVATLLHLTNIRSIALTIQVKTLWQLPLRHMRPTILLIDKPKSLVTGWAVIQGYGRTENTLSSTLSGCTSTSIFTSYAAYLYPNPEAAVPEHILVDTHGAFSPGFADAITPCANYVSGNQSMGRETAAQWPRVAFHDFVTVHVAETRNGC
jgi:hypothetical protein